ncbi:MAG: hypothetical protein ACRDGB_11770 [Candidatus Limnocylindria bacterium]
MPDDGATVGSADGAADGLSIGSPDDSGDDDGDGVKVPPTTETDPVAEGAVDGEEHADRMVSSTSRIGTRLG